MDGNLNTVRMTCRIEAKYYLIRVAEDIVGDIFDTGCYSYEFRKLGSNPNDYTRQILTLKGDVKQRETNTNLS